MVDRVKFVDHGLVDLFARLAELQQLELTVGFQGEKGSAIHPLADVPVATVALYNEFGTIDTPARSFLRSTMFERRQDIVDAYARECGRVAQGKATALEALSAIGAVVAGLVRDKIDQAHSWATPNAPSTIEKKGHAQPLLGGDPAKGIAGGTLKNAVTWAVRKQGTVIAEGA